MKTKSIGEAPVLRPYLCLPIVKEAVGCYLFHFMLMMVGFPVIFVPGQCIHPFHILLFGPDTQMKRIFVIQISPIGTRNMMHTF
ncbi:hypothetical protein D3C80_1959670 [compost metagenome]